MILVTGATGHLGSSVVTQLLKLGARDKFIATSSTPAGVQQLEEQGLLVRQADFSDKSSLSTALEGVKKLLLISTMDPNRYEQHRNVIDAAKHQGVEHIIYTSVAIKDIQISGVKDLMISHFQTEDYLKASGINYTILRNSMYADSFLQILGSQALNSNIMLPGGDGKVPYALRSEMGEATANLLLQVGHENKTYNITGSHSVGYAEVASALSKLSGRTIEYIDISEDQFKNNLISIGFPEFLIYLHAGTIYDIKHRQYELESDMLEKLLERKPAGMEEYLSKLFTTKS